MTRHRVTLQVRLPEVEFNDRMIPYLMNQVAAARVTEREACRAAVEFLLRGIRVKTSYSVSDLPQKPSPRAPRHVIRAGAVPGVREALWPVVGLKNGPRGRMVLRTRLSD